MILKGGSKGRWQRWLAGVGGLPCSSAWIITVNPRRLGWEGAGVCEHTDSHGPWRAPTSLPGSRSHSVPAIYSSACGV